MEGMPEENQIKNSLIIIFDQFVLKNLSNHKNKIISNLFELLLIRYGIEIEKS
jgi:hypothetical protein